MGLNTGDETSENNNRMNRSRHQCGKRKVGAPDYDIKANGMSAQRYGT